MYVIKVAKHNLKLNDIEKYQFIGFLSNICSNMHKNNEICKKNK